MSRRNRGGNPISLFAFQDIITSVSGIFIVMVLLLTLELVERSSAKAPDLVEKALAKDVREATARAEREITELKRRAAHGDDLLHEAAQTSRDELKEGIAARERDIARLTTRIQQANARTELLSEHSEAVAVEQFDLRDEREDFEQLEREIAELQQRLEAEEQSDRPIFTLPRGLRKQGWLTVLDDGEIKIAPLGRPATPIVFRGTPGLIFDSAAADGLLEWTDEQEAESLYLLLLIRPDGIDAFNTLQAELDLRSVEFGFDLIEQDQEVLHPTRGAAP